MSKIYTLFCNACGKRFRANREHARTCSPGCRLAISNLKKIIKQMPDELSEEDKENYKNSTILVAEAETGTIKRMLIPKQEDGPIILPKEVVDQLPLKESKIAASKGKKVDPAPKNDKNLMPGEDLKEQRKLEKKSKKKKKED